MKRFIKRLIASAMLSLSIVGCTVAASYGQDKVVRIGFQKYGKLVLLKSKGTLEGKLKAAGYQVVWTEFPSGPPLLEALNVGAIDFGNTGEAPPIFAQAAGAPIQYVAYEPPAPKGEAILVPKDSKLNSVADLRGKKVALNKGSNVHYLLVKALEKAGVKYSEIETVFLAPADARAAFERGAVDAWVIWDPFLAAAEAATGARTLADGSGIVSNYQFYFSSKKFLENDPAIVDLVLAQLGDVDVLLPTGRSCEDSWVVASAVAPFTERLRYLVAVRPGLQSPSVAARMTATLDRISNGRLLINVVTGGDPVENKGDGIFLDHDARYAVTREFLNVYSDLLAGKTVNVEGKHIRIEAGRLLFPPVQSPRPPLYFGGSSDAGIDVAVDTVDKYLTWGEPPAQVAEKINRVKAAAANRGRQLSFGIRLHVIVRETNAEAWNAADDLIKHVTDETVTSAQKIFARMDSVGQQRMSKLHGGRRDKLEISPNLWAGVGLVRGGAGTALVGDPPTVAARIREYQDVGIDTFIMSGYPHLEEAFRFAELVFPHLALERSSNVTPIRVNTGPFGETIANEHRPLVKASQS